MSEVIGVVHHLVDFLQVRVDLGIPVREEPDLLRPVTLDDPIVGRDSPRVLVGYVPQHRTVLEASIARSAGGPTGSPRWYIISFCTTTPRFHIGAWSTWGGSNGPSGQYVKPPGEPRYHHVMTCAILTR